MDGVEAPHAKAPDVPSPYEPLPDGSIRLLELHPGEFGSPLVGHLRTVSLSETTARAHAIAETIIQSPQLDYTYSLEHAYDSANATLVVSFSSPPMTGAEITLPLNDLFDNGAFSHRGLRDQYSAKHFRLVAPVPSAYMVTSAKERLVRVHTKTLQHTPSTCSTVLEDAILNTLVSYEALSYVWSDTSTPQSLHLTEGLLLPITASLYEALQHLRYPNTVRTVWVDAICIDQSNLAERGKQVGSISDIYAPAKQVIVWRGPANSTYDNLALCAAQFQSHGRTDARGTQIDAFDRNASAYSKVTWMFFRGACLPG